MSANTQFADIMDKYRNGVEPLENWESQDLSQLETLINAELQERHQTEQRYAYPSCHCEACDLLRGTPNGI